MTDLLPSLPILLLAFTGLIFILSPERRETHELLSPTEQEKEE
ncbi:hypothetical protein [Hymenobacter sp. BT491]|nr:hypothetical protein [Hymenobacter sp. BT491]